MREAFVVGLVWAVVGIAAEADDTAGGMVAMSRDAEVGAGFSSGGPRRCESQSAPSNGPPSIGQATAYVICGREREIARALYLVGDISVDAIAPGRAYNYVEDRNVPGIDVNRPVYPIRGRFEEFVCNPTDTGPGWGPAYTTGTNCTVTLHSNANGLCYQDTFGDWTCRLNDHNARYNARVEVPPPV